MIYYLLRNEVLILNIKNPPRLTNNEQEYLKSLVINKNQLYKNIGTGFMLVLGLLSALISMVDTHWEYRVGIPVIIGGLGIVINLFYRKKVKLVPNFDDKKVNISGKLIEREYQFSTDIKVGYFIEDLQVIFPLSWFDHNLIQTHQSYSGFYDKNKDCFFVLDSDTKSVNDQVDKGLLKIYENFAILFGAIVLSVTVIILSLFSNYYELNSIENMSNDLSEKFFPKKVDTWKNISDKELQVGQTFAINDVVQISIKSFDNTKILNSSLEWNTFMNKFKSIYTEFNTANIKKLNHINSNKFEELFHIIQSENPTLNKELISLLYKKKSFSKINKFVKEEVAKLGVFSNNKTFELKNYLSLKNEFKDVYTLNKYYNDLNPYLSEGRSVFEVLRLKQNEILIQKKDSSIELTTGTILFYLFSLMLIIFVFRFCQKIISNKKIANNLVH